MKHCTKTVYFVTNVYACCIPACSRALVKCVFTCVLRVFNMGMFLAKEVCTVMLLHVRASLLYVRSFLSSKSLYGKSAIRLDGGGVAGWIGSRRIVGPRSEFSILRSKEPSPPLCPIIPATPRVEYFYPPFFPPFYCVPVISRKIASNKFPVDTHARVRPTETVSL